MGLWNGWGFEDVGLGWFLCKGFGLMVEGLVINQTPCPSFNHTKPSQHNFPKLLVRFG